MDELDTELVNLRQSGQTPVICDDDVLADANSDAEKPRNVVYVFGEAVNLDDPSSAEMLRQQKEKMRWWNIIYATLSDPGFNFLAMTYTVAMCVAIFLSTVTFVVSSQAEYQCKGCMPASFEMIDLCVIVLFTADYVLRLATYTGNRLRWIFLDFMNVIDLLAVLPFYIELVAAAAMGVDDAGISALVFLRALRLFRVFRILKVSKYSRQLPVAIKALKMSGGGFFLAFFSISLFCILFSSAMFFAESSGMYFDTQDRLWRYQSDGSESRFQSIPHTMWWALVTMTTVGYGDMFPLTGPGKIVGTATVVIGILVLAFPLTILSNNFGSASESSDNKREEHTRRRLMRAFARGEHVHEPDEVIVAEMWDTMLSLKRNLDGAVGSLESFQREYEKMELLLGQLRRKYRQLQHPKDAKKAKRRGRSQKTVTREDQLFA